MYKKEHWPKNVAWCKNIVRVSKLICLKNLNIRTTLGFGFWMSHSYLESKCLTRIKVDPMRILLHDITSHSMYQITLMTLFNRTRYSGRKLSTWDRGVNGQSPCSPRHQRNICLQGWVRWQWDGKNSHRRGFISFKLIHGHRQWCFIGHYTDPANSRRGEGAWRFNDYCYRLESSFSYRFRFH